MKTVGIIGFGSFGKFLAEKLSSHAKVLVYSYSGAGSSWQESIEQVAGCDYVIPAIPLDAYPRVLKQIKPLLGKNSVVVDVCSVKNKPIMYLHQHLPGTKFVAAHPMFGPESAGVSFDGHTLVMCPEGGMHEGYQAVKQFAQSLGLSVIEMSADEHDEEIAVVQGLTFFIARALNSVGVEGQKLHTPSFARLLHLAELEKHHSSELFTTIQNGNPKTSEVRQAFLRAAEEIDNRLANENTR